MKKLIFFLSTVLVVALLVTSCTNPVFFKPILDLAVKSAPNSSYFTGDAVNVGWKVVSNLNEPEFSYTVEVTKPDSSKVNLTGATIEGITIPASVTDVSGNYSVNIVVNEATKKLNVSGTYAFQVKDKALEFSAFTIGGVSQVPLFSDVWPVKLNINTVSGRPEVIEWSLDLGYTWVESPAATTVLVDEAAISANDYSVDEGVNALFARVKGSDDIHQCAFIVDNAAPEIAVSASSRESADTVFGASFPAGRATMFKILIKDEEYYSDFTNIALGFRKALDSDGRNVARIIIPGVTDASGYVFIHPEDLSPVLDMSKNYNLELFLLITDNDVKIFQSINFGGNTYNLAEIPVYSEAGDKIDLADYYKFDLDTPYYFGIYADDFFGNHKFVLTSFVLNERYAESEKPAIWLEAGNGTKAVSVTKDADNKVSFKVRLNSNNLPEYFAKVKNNHGVISIDTLKYNDVKYMEVPISIASADATVSTILPTYGDFLSGNSQYELFDASPITGDNTYMLTKSISPMLSDNTDSGLTGGIIAEFDVTLTVPATGLYTVSIPYLETFMDKFVDSDGKTIDGIITDYKPVVIDVQ